jgi:hypothetical protein
MLDTIIAKTGSDVTILFHGTFSSWKIFQIHHIKLLIIFFIIKFIINIYIFDHLHEKNRGKREWFTIIGKPIMTYCTVSGGAGLITKIIFCYMDNLKLNN